MSNFDSTKKRLADLLRDIVSGKFNCLTSSDAGSRKRKTSVPYW